MTISLSTAKRLSLADFADYNAAARQLADPRAHQLQAIMVMPYQTPGWVGPAERYLDRAWS